MPVASVVTDGAGVIRAANAAAARLFDAEARRLRGRSIAALVDPTATARIRALMDQPDADLEVELPFCRVRGAPFDGAVRCSRRGDELIFVVRVVARANGAAPRENTEIRARGEALTGAPNDVAPLMRALRDKDEIIARERAIRAQLEKSDRAKDRFIAILSHDLRGPIHSVLGWTQLLRREVLGKDARERALATIERSTRTQLELVEELLDLSRITADKMALELVPVDLTTLCQRIVESFAPIATEAGIELRGDVDLDAPRPTIFGDRKRLTQIASNLLSNAIKFTPAGGRVDVRVGVDGAHAVLEVRDTGEGIKPELRAELFDCYRQGATAATARAGLGLGLYIVQKLVQMHGGSVEAESEGVGTGSRFVVRLPLRESPPALASEHGIADDGGPDLAGLRILVVEDDPDALDLLATVLAGRGASVSAASHAAQALAMFDSFAPDVVVSDIELPGEDGCAFVRRLRERSADIPAIAVSGFAAVNDAARALHAGFDVHVSKPIEAKKLVTAICELARRPS